MLVDAKVASKLNINWAKLSKFIEANEKSLLSKLKALFHENPRPDEKQLIILDDVIDIFNECNSGLSEEDLSDLFIVLDLVESTEKEDLVYFKSLIQAPYHYSKRINQFGKFPSIIAKERQSDVSAFAIRYLKEATTTKADFMEQALVELPSEEEED